MHTSIASTLALRIACRRVAALGNSAAVGRGDTVQASAECSITRDGCKLLTNIYRCRRCSRTIGAPL
jgi:hypothetical protein